MWPRGEAPGFCWKGRGGAGGRPGGTGGAGSTLDGGRGRRGCSTAQVRPETYPHPHPRRGVLTPDGMTG